jgi:hypothetical protein
VRRIGSHSERDGRLQLMLALSQSSIGQKIELTFFNAVLLGVLLVDWLSVIGTCDTLDTFIEVVLRWGTGFGLPAFYTKLEFVHMPYNRTELPGPSKETQYSNYLPLEL